VPTFSQAELKKKQQEKGKA
jgi:ATP-binding cassette subfamily B (MDR/TAP) protein 1